MLASAGAGADIANRDPPYKEKAPPTAANLARALTCVIWAHMPGNMTRQL